MPELKSLQKPHQAHQLKHNSINLQQQEILHTHTHTPPICFSSNFFQPHIQEVIATFNSLLGITMTQLPKFTWYHTTHSSYILKYPFKKNSRNAELNYLGREHSLTTALNQLKLSIPRNCKKQDHLIKIFKTLKHKINMYTPHDKKPRRLVHIMMQKHPDCSMLRIGQ